MGSHRQEIRSLTIDIEWGSPLRVKDTSLTRRRVPCDKQPMYRRITFKMIVCRIDWLFWVLCRIGKDVQWKPASFKLNFLNSLFSLTARVRKFSSQSICSLSYFRYTWILLILTCQLINILFAFFPLVSD